MPIGTAVHDRTFALCESLNYREWSGYYAVSAYESHHEHEYNAIRNASALIDVSPLFKYLVTGKDAPRLVDRIITRDVARWRSARSTTRPGATSTARSSTTAPCRGWRSTRFAGPRRIPSLRWLRQNAAGLDVHVEDISEQVAALALQGPTSARLLRAVAEADIDRSEILPRHDRERIAGVPVDISRTGYTGDLGYEIWMPAERAVHGLGRAHSRAAVRSISSPPGMLALDVARIEAGLLLIEVDFFSSRKAMIRGADRTRRTRWVSAVWSTSSKGRFIGQQGARGGSAPRPGAPGGGAGDRLERSRTAVRHVGLPPAVAATASRVAVPVYRERPPGRQGDVDDVVAGAEADDRARDGRSSALRRGQRRADRDDRRSRPPSRGGDGGEDTVLQPAAQEATPA